MVNAILKDEMESEQGFGDELAAGSTLMQGQYTIDSFLNAGGFGITYSARDSLDRRVVIKECFPGAFCRRSTALVTARSRAHQSELASIVRLFVQEARSMSKLDHPNIVGVHQVFEENNTAYMALDFVEGCDLLAVIEEGMIKLSPEEVENILRKVLDAITFVHGQGILHRDISPDNILLDQDKNPVLIDFGAAREQASKKSRVLSALRVVKDGYSPQEFYVTGSEQGPYSDLYALGATFYHLMTGRLPPDAQTRLSALASGEKDPYRPLLNRLATYRKPLLHSIDTALAILPKDRIASAPDWLAMLDSDAPIPKPRVVSQTVNSKGAAGTQQTSAEDKPKSKKVLLLASVAVVAMVAVGVVTTQGDLLSPSADPQTAAEEATPAVVPAPAAAPAPSVETRPATETVEAPVSTEPTQEAAAAPEPEPNPVSVVTAVPSLDTVDTNAVAAPVVPTPVTSPDIWEHLPMDTAPGDDPAPVVLTAPAEAPVKPAAAPVETAAVPTASPHAWTQEAPVIVPAPVAEAPAATPVDPPVTEESAPEQQEVPTPVVIAESDTPVSPDVPAEISGPPGLSTSWATKVPTEWSFGPESGDAQVLAVNGSPVTSREDFDEALRLTASVPNSGEITAAITLATGSAEPVTEDWDLPVVQDTILSNGLAFETKVEDGSWTTRITAVPETVGENLQVGDAIFAHMGSGTFFNERMSLPEVIEKIARGELDTSIALIRAGNTQAVSLPVPKDGIN